MPNSHESTRHAFNEAYELYADGLYRYGTVKLSDAEAARDVVQDTFMRYWDMLRRGTVIREERAVLFTIARRLIIDRYRARKKTSLDALREDGFEPPDPKAQSPERFAEGNHALLALSKLPDEYQDVLTLRFVEGLAPREIAIVLGESSNAVTVRIHRGLAKLRILLAYDKKP